MPKQNGFGKLHKELQELHGFLQAGMKKKWKRSLPFEEELFDRWERAKSLGFGKKSSIYQLSYVYGNVRVGANTWVGPFTVLDGSGGLTIGDYCSISAGVQIYTHDSVRWALSGGKAECEKAPVKIGNNCYIGSGAVVVKGVTIGDHSLIGASSLVNKDIPPYSVIFGTPARIVGRVEVDAAGGVRILYEENQK